MKFRDYQNYQRGKSPEGHDVFRIPLRPDQDGMIGRECPLEDCQPRYFKVAMAEDTEEPTDVDSQEELMQQTLFCPYCGHQADAQSFTTLDQMEYASSVFRRAIFKDIQDMMADAFRPKRPQRKEGLISINISFKPGPLPSVRHYIEKDLKRVTECDQCYSKYAVYGIAMLCPFCGSGTIKHHIIRSSSIVETQLGAKFVVEEKGGSEAAYHLLGNCLEDCVSLFEGFMKKIYSQALAQALAEDQCKRKVENLRNSFQNLSKAENILRDDLNLNLFDRISQGDRSFLELQFAKRHVIAHNLSEVDERYQSQVQSWQDSGQNVELNENEIKRALELVQALLISIVEQLPS